VDGTNGKVRDVQNVADVLVRPEGSLERRNHWEKTSHAMLSPAAMLHVLYDETDKTLRVLPFSLRSRTSWRKTGKKEGGGVWGLWKSDFFFLEGGVFFLGGLGGGGRRELISGQV